MPHVCLVRKICGSLGAIFSEEVQKFVVFPCGLVWSERVGNTLFSPAVLYRRKDLIVHFSVKKLLANLQSSLLGLCASVGANMWFGSTIVDSGNIPRSVAPGFPVQPLGLFHQVFP